MSTKLQALIDAVQELSPPEQLELMRALSQSLHRSYQQTPLMVDFWKPRTLDQLL